MHIEYVLPLPFDIMKFALMKLSYQFLLLRIPTSYTIGVELHDDVIEHCKTSVARWKDSTVEVKDGNSTIHFMDDKIADIQIVKGNGLNILRTSGEGVVGFDRIYIGAAVDKEDLDNITKLLSPGGILVGPSKYRHVLCIVSNGNANHFAQPSTSNS